MNSARVAGGTPWKVSVLALSAPALAKTVGTDRACVRIALQAAVAPAVGALGGWVGVGEVAVSAGLRRPSSTVLEEQSRWKLTQIRPACQLSGTLKLTEV